MKTFTAYRKFKSLLFMKNFIVIFLIIIGGCTSQSNKNALVSDTDLEYAKSVFTELQQALQLDNGKLWNFKLDGPVLLINKETKVVIANEPDEDGTLTKQGELYVGILPENIVGGNTTIEWLGKRWATYSLPLSEDRATRVDGLIHESFHRIQPEIGFDNITDNHSVHLDTKDGRIFLKLEYEALNSALQSDEPLVHIKNALHFRQYRHQLFPDSKNVENSLEIMEGLAQYTGSILSPRTDEEYKQYYITLIEMSKGFPSYVRSFAYFTIPVYGFFMKQDDEQWNLKINRDTNLTDFILAFYKLDQTTKNYETIKKIGKLYGIENILEAEDLREKNRLDQERKYKSIFLSDSVLVIPLQKMSINFDPRNITPLDSFGSVYPIMIVTDNWGILHVDSLGALMSPEWNKVTLSYPKSITDSLVLGDGWRLKLNSPWKLKKVNVKYTLTDKQ